MAPVEKIVKKGNDVEDNDKVGEIVYVYLYKLYAFVNDVLFDRRWYWPFVALLLAGEAMLCLLIIKKIPCESATRQAADERTR
jgi:hypothetical protein